MKKFFLAAASAAILLSTPAASATTLLTYEFEGVHAFLNAAETTISGTFTIEQFGFVVSSAIDVENPFNTVPRTAGNYTMLSYGPILLTDFSGQSLNIRTDQPFLGGSAQTVFTVHEIDYDRLNLGEFRDFAVAGGNLGTIQLIAVANVPEPSTWVMMLLGFVGLGFVTYRKKQSVSVA